MRKLLTIAAALLIIITACSKDDTTTSPINTNNNSSNSGSSSVCKMQSTKYYDSTGQLVSESNYYYSNGLEDSIVTYNINNPDIRNKTVFIYQSKYERKRILLVNGTELSFHYLEKINDKGLIIESRTIGSGGINSGYTTTSYTCN